jgi:hypothetical protein
VVVHAVVLPRLFEVGVVVLLHAVEQRGASWPLVVVVAWRLGEQGVVPQQFHAVGEVPRPLVVVVVVVLPPPHRAVAPRQQHAGAVPPHAVDAVDAVCQKFDDVFTHFFCLPCDLGARTRVFVWMHMYVCVRFLPGYILVFLVCFLPFFLIDFTISVLQEVLPPSRKLPMPSMTN